MDPESSATPLERSVSQQSSASVNSRRSGRSTTRGQRGSSSRRLASSHVSSSASSVAASSVEDKSLTSFPSFSPESPRAGRACFDAEAVMAASGSAATTTQQQQRPPAAPSSSVTLRDLASDADSTPTPTTRSQPSTSVAAAAVAAAARTALFDDEPLTAQSIPGALHLASDAHIERLIARQRGGAPALVRQVAEDLARRDAQMAALRRRADERERALRRIVLECGLSNLELETRLRTVEAELRAAAGAGAGAGGVGVDGRTPAESGGLSDMMSDAMRDSVAYNLDSTDATIRASSLFTGAGGEPKNGGTAKGWKDYLWGGGTSRKSSRASSVNGDATAAAATKQTQQPQPTVIRRNTPVVDKRPGLAEDLFSPPPPLPSDAASLRTSSRASSIHNGSAQGAGGGAAQGGVRKASTSLAGLALRLVAGGSTSSTSASTRDGEGTRGRANSASLGDSARGSSQASNRTTQSNRAVSTQGGPKALMAMRRATPANLPIATGAAAAVAVAAARIQTQERWDTMVGSPPSSATSRQESYGPVEMDTILPAEIQPPTLTHIYNNYPNSEYLTDRFGFIYDQRRKKRQRDAARMAGHIKKGSRTEMLTNGRPGLSPIVADDAASVKWDAASDGRPESPSSTAEAGEEGRPKRWQDYLKIATFPTELLSHTPSISIPTLEVTEGSSDNNNNNASGSRRGSETPKSPAAITADERGFLPAASAPVVAAVDSGDSTPPAPANASSSSGGGGGGTLVKEDAEPVKLLLRQLSELHDSLQRDKTVRWNDFLRKVRAERRREGEAAMAREAAASEARFERPAVMLPEATLADGEMIGIAGLGNKGKVGRAKWNEFKALVLGGIPVAYRAKIWSECSGATANRVPGYYDDLVARSGEDDDPTVVSQIEMDIHRTLTDNIFFRKGPGVAKLSEVLLAYSRRNADVGYCQGMNLIAANLLLIMPSAEDAFWILTAMIETILPAGYYDHSLRASRADQQVLRQYVGEVLPRLSQHLEELQIELEALTFQWFLSVFTDCLSAEALFRVWDVVLCTNDGSTFLFQVALALLKLNEPQLLQCDTPAGVYTYINHQMTNHAISIDGLVQASEGLRRVVRREEAEARRLKVEEAEAEAAKAREEQRRLAREDASRGRARSGTAGTGGTAGSELDVREPIPMDQEDGGGGGGV